MFNLLIADDEELERKAVQKVISGAFTDVFNIYSAKNGREAIEIGFNVKPDIVIVDIKMPGINGLEAIKELKKSLKDTYFIILTAYDYFDYAKEAIINDVKDYMLKPFKREELIKRIRKALDILEEQKQNRTMEIELKEKIYSMLPVLKNELVFAIVSENLNSIDYKAYLNYLNLNFDVGYCMIISMDNENNGQILEKSGRNEAKTKVKNYLEEVINPYHNVLLSGMFTKDIILFVQCRPDSDDYMIKLEAVALARKIAVTIKEKMNLYMSIGIGRACAGIEKLSESYQEALISQKYNRNDIKHYEDIIFSETAQVTDNNKNTMPLEYDFSVIEKKGNSNHSDLLMKAKKFIEENYNKDITMEETAHQVGVSPYYFSKIFKTSVGKNYMDYLTELRIEKAKDMLKDGFESIKEICYEVGYNDPNYFSRVFKKIEGLTPSEYKIRLGG